MVKHAAHIASEGSQLRIWLCAHVTGKWAGHVAGGPCGLRHSDWLKTMTCGSVASSPPGRPVTCASDVSMPPKSSQNPSPPPTDRDRPSRASSSATDLSSLPSPRSPSPTHRPPTPPSDTTDKARPPARPVVRNTFDLEPNPFEQSFSRSGNPVHTLVCPSGAVVLSNLPRPEHAPQAVARLRPAARHCRPPSEMAQKRPSRFCPRSHRFLLPVGPMHLAIGDWVGARFPAVCAVGRSLLPFSTAPRSSLLASQMAPVSADGTPRIPPFAPASPQMSAAPVRCPWVFARLLNLHRPHSARRRPRLFPPALAQYRRLSRNGHKPHLWRIGRHDRRRRSQRRHGSWLECNHYTRHSDCTRK